MIQTPGRGRVLGSLGALLVLAGLSLVLPGLASPQAAGAKASTAHGFSMYGDLKYPAGFSHFQYVNPEAPKGGDVKLAAIGTFDTLNPFVLKGVPAVGLGGAFDTLTVQSEDEPFSEYGLVAETIEIPADRSWVAFTLRPQARFHDGSPITVEDVIWTFGALKTKGRPFFRAYYAQVTKAEKVGERKVRFAFGPGDNRELPLIVGQLPVLSRAYWSTRDFEKTTLEPPLGSGAYRVESVDPGRSITYRRVKDYWGAKLPVNAGRDNFDALRYDYYRDSTVAIEALKGGEYDFRLENVAKNWATAYATPAVTRGLLKKEEIRNEIPTGMQGFAFNIRRPLFQDPRVRRALGYAFDFEWSNKNLFYGAYTRTRSYFSNSELASSGLPSAEELKILEPFRGKIPDEVFTKEYQPPTTDGSGNIRDGVREALRLLGEAGWAVKGQKLVNARGEPMQFEILLSEPTWERIALPFAKNLERLGITARVRVVDAAQYEKRQDDFDFDVIVALWPESLSPGNEQREFWGSQAAAEPRSRNLVGIKDPIVDRLIDLVIQAPDRPSLVARTRALDRVLLWGHYVVPHWHIRAFRVVYWDKFARPAVSPKNALGFDTWWVDATKEAALARRRGEIPK
ncbi:MAG TPA: extracellular solute-binding protein [Methylomirabilota bacterium]|jgi:microcin C transport system substrate-binding protein